MHDRKSKRVKRRARVRRLKMKIWMTMRSL